ncbi:MAG: cytosolic protein [Chloroflexi bacterium]|nr:MAG: cytosolic protein [Chloroflexota bacterium]
MQPLNLNDVFLYVEDNIGDFHNRKLLSLRNLKLEKILKRKNPYLFKAKNVIPQELTKGILDAHLSSQEETIFGGFLEGLAIFVCGKVWNGRKSSAEGIDLEFERDNKHYIVSVKSGPNWGNSSQIKRMKNNFQKAKRILRTSGSNMPHIVAVNGCCYGKNKSQDKGDYFKICGQEFWNLISENDHLYLDIVEPLGVQAKERNEEFSENYNDILTQFTREFLNIFCLDSGKIDWDKLVQFNSGRG